MADRRKSIPKPRIPEAISIQLTAAILDVSEKTVRRWIRFGYILAYRVGPQLIRIPRSEIIRMRSVRLPFLVEEEQTKLHQI